MAVEEEEEERRKGRELQQQVAAANEGRGGVGLIGVTGKEG